MKRDLNNFLFLMQLQKDSMEKAYNAAAEELKQGTITQEIADLVTAYYQIVYDNYRRVLYCFHLLNLPPKFIQKILNKILNCRLIKKLQAATDEEKKFEEDKVDTEAIVSENEDAINNVESVVKNESDS